MLYNSTSIVPLPGNNPKYYCLTYCYNLSTDSFYHNFSNKLPITSSKGLCIVKQNQNIRVDYGSRWVGPGLTRIFLGFFGENRPKIALNQY